MMMHMVQPFQDQYRNQYGRHRIVHCHYINIPSYDCLRYFLLLVQTEKLLCFHCIHQSLNQQDLNQNLSQIIEIISCIHFRTFQYNQQKSYFHDELIQNNMIYLFVIWIQIHLHLQQFLKTCHSETFHLLYHCMTNKNLSNQHTFL